MKVFHVVGCCYLESPRPHCGAGQRQDQEGYWGLHCAVMIVVEWHFVSCAGDDALETTW